nr:MAG TPA: hypothetical protein [Caudoviricetes sp.]
MTQSVHIASTLWEIQNGSGWLQPFISSCFYLGLCVSY